MKQPIIFCSPLLAALIIAPLAHAITYYAGPSGSGTTCAQATPCSVATAAGKTAPGDTVYLISGTYSGYLSPPNSGNASNWITYSAAPGALPIFDGASGTAVGSTTATYIRFVGIVSRNHSSSGFANPWTDSNCATMSASNRQYINCIADGNGVNGISHYCATGLLIQNSITAHNGNQQPSWSSGVNLFHVTGDHTANQIIGNVSFENIDISSNHSDGSGFILDQSSTGALFENNIGFRNGGSCIRINCPGAYIINNSCFHDGLEATDAQGQPTNPGEIYFSSGPQGAVMVNNLAAASGYNNTQNVTNQATLGSNNLFVNANGATPFFTDPAGTNPDFRLTASATTNIVDKGTTTNAPTTDIGFDPKCIAKGSPGGASWWAYTIDYTYIANLGGVAKCFNPATRSGTPDIGAYEYNGTAGTGGAPGTGGTTSTGGTKATGGTTSTGGIASTGGAQATGGALGTGGTVVTGTGGTKASGGSPGTGGSTVAGMGGVKATGGTLGAGGTVVASTGGTANVGGAKASGGMPGSGGIFAMTGGVANAGGSMGVGGGAATVGGAANTGGDVGAAGDTSTGGAGNATDVGSCSCRVTGGSSRSSTMAGFGMLGLIVLATLRRRRSP